MNDMSDPVAPRKSWMSLLAKAKPGSVSTYLDAHFKRPDFTWLRPPEIGSVMVQGRAGGTGSPFNLGEMTVTRCTLKLATGEVGFAYIQGRSKSCAEAAALVDAMMQTEVAEDIHTNVLAPLQADAAAAKTLRAEKAAATKVDFFTMVRGED